MIIRLTRAEVKTLKAIGLVYIVHIEKDVSVRVPGAVEAAFHDVNDAFREKKRLDKAYSVEDAFKMVDLRVASLRFED